LPKEEGYDENMDTKRIPIVVRDNFAVVKVFFLLGKDIHYKTLRNM
jgi:hypothetical protein